MLYRVGGTDGHAAFGFAYGTPTNHAESGEELFEVFIDQDSGEVRYRLPSGAVLSGLGGGNESWHIVMIRFDDERRPS